MIKSIAKNILGKLGLEVRRPEFTAAEISHLASWEDYFALDPERFMRIMKGNRETLGKVERWISRDTYENSFWRYGIHIDPAELDLIDNHVTYSDLILFLASYLEHQPSYLEIGVSAGKNFLQICDYLNDAVLVGIDIEEINPVLERFLKDGRLLSEFDKGGRFKDFRGVERHKVSTLKGYNYPGNNNEVLYLSGDKFREELWQQLEGRKFNLVFSDACHKPESIKSEMQMIHRFGLLDQDEFIILWDDLGGVMTDAYFQIVSELKDRLGSDIRTEMLKIRGTYGVQGPRKVGLAYRLPALKL